MHNDYPPIIFDRRFLSFIIQNAKRLRTTAHSSGHSSKMTHRAGRHFLQVPGPSNVPDRVLRAIAAPTIDHRSPAFARLALEVIDGLKAVFQTSGAIMIYPASGTGAWEAALTNVLSPGDR